MPQVATAQILRIVARALGIPDGFELQPGAAIADVPGWDSYGWIAVIAGIERHCATEFPIDRIDDIRRVGDLLAVVASLPPSSQKETNQT